LLKVRRSRGTRTPSGMIIRKATDARIAWSLSLLSYSDKGRNMVSV
jgi:hypothetical protein